MSTVRRFTQSANSTTAPTKSGWWHIFRASRFASTGTGGCQNKKVPNPFQNRSADHWRDELPCRHRWYISSDPHATTGRAADSSKMKCKELSFCCWWDVATSCPRLAVVRVDLKQRRWQLDWRAGLRFVALLAFTMRMQTQHRRDFGYSLSTAMHDFIKKAFGLCGSRGQMLTAMFVWNVRILSTFAGAPAASAACTANWHLHARLRQTP